MLRWSDKPPSSHHILSNITLYYLTRTFSTSLYHYWSAPPSAHVDAESQPDSKKLKAKGTPVGYSLFQKEILPTPIEWVKGEVNMVWSKKHDQVSTDMKRNREGFQPCVPEVYEADGGLGRSLRCSGKTGRPRGGCSRLPERGVETLTRVTAFSIPLSLRHPFSSAF